MALTQFLFSTISYFFNKLRFCNSIFNSFMPELADNFSFSKSLFKDIQFPQREYL
jgi:hypothetical protein